MSSQVISYLPIGWLNWRAVGHIDFADMAYLVLFGFVVWLLIQAIDYLYERNKSKKNQGK